ncbi:hypothetical protein BJ742DRAFT_440406 [Cladochytrium replicatum]|nr:hypothetical protein BJ742DRAFT_440406 [Cladochytrium replicatum]
MLGQAVCCSLLLHPESLGSLSQRVRKCLPCTDVCSLTFSVDFDLYGSPGDDWIADTEALIRAIASQFALDLFDFGESNFILKEFVDGCLLCSSEYRPDYMMPWPLYKDPFQDPEFRDLCTSRTPRNLNFRCRILLPTPLQPHTSNPLLSIHSYPRRANPKPRRFNNTIGAGRFAARKRSYTLSLRRYR